MTAWQRIAPLIISGLSWWSGLGLFVLLAGLALVADGSRYATQLNLLLFLPGIFLALLASYWVVLFRSLSGGILLALLGWVLVCAWLNPGGEIDLFRWFKVCLQLLVLMVVVGGLLQRPRLFEGVLVAAVIVAMLCAWLSLYQNYWVLGHPWGYRLHRLEASGVGQLADFGNAIVAGLYYASMAILALGLWHRVTPAWARVLWLAGLAGLCMAVFMTYARGVWIALVLASVCFWGLSLLRRSFVLLVLSLAAVALVAAVLEPQLMAKVFLNLTHREEIWQYTVARLEDTWLLGVGPAAPFNACVAVLKQCFNQAHSLYLQMLFEFGAVGVALFLGLIASLLLGVRHQHDERYVRLAVPLLVFALIAGVASYHAVFPRPGLVWVFLWLPIGILLAMPCVSGRPECVGSE